VGRYQFHEELFILSTLPLHPPQRCSFFGGASDVMKLTRKWMRPDIACTGEKNEIFVGRVTRSRLKPGLHVLNPAMEVFLRNGVILAPGR